MARAHRASTQTGPAPTRLISRSARLLAIGGLTASVAAAAAEATPDAPQRVEVTGAAVADDGRDATAARVVVSREDIARYGDTSVTEVLRRVPGITVSGTQGRASEIRLRGLGSGYTQILVNGEAVPAGFTLESLPASQIERIEISRVATVDVGSQAIAGTINIILRQSARKGQRELKASVGSRSGQPSYALDAQFSDRLDDFSYALGAGLSRKTDVWPSGIVQEASDAAGVPVLQRQTQVRAFGPAQAISLTPKLSWQLGARDKLSIEAVLRHTRFDDHSEDQRSVALGGPPPYLSDELRLALKTTFAQGRLNWTRVLDNEATVDLRLGASQLRRASDASFRGRDERQDLAMDEHVNSSTTDRALTAAGKLRLPYSQGHAAALGWDGESAVRDEARRQRQFSPTGRPAVDRDESYASTVERLALYAQDEWDVNDALALYAGLRWARLATRTEGAAFTPVSNRSAVLSPVLQALWKPGGANGDPWRAALSRSYKAPRTVDLSPRRFVAIDNTATTPDLQGNPDLRPELAWGIDLAYEHTLARDAGTLGINVSARRIRDVILDRLSFDNGAWVSTKANQGSARVYGLELDSRWLSRAAWPGAPDAELRASLSRNWSTVDQVPGPDNRLGSQIPLSAKLGADWRAAGLPLTMGGSLAWQGRMRAQTSATQTSMSNARSTLDLYVLWKLNPGLQWRAAISNALRPHEVSTETHADGSGALRQTSDAPSEPTFRLALELKL